MSDLCKEVENFGKGIGSVPRYRIIQALTRGTKTVNELVAITGLSQPAVSQHLKLLKSYNLVSSQRKGQEVFYAINTAHALELLKNLVQEIKK